MVYENGNNLLKSYLDDEERKAMKDFIISLSIRKEKKAIQNRVSEINIDNIIKNKKRI